MIVKDIIFTDFVNYKKPSMTIACPRCSFKCDKAYGKDICQNLPLVQSPDIEIDNEILVDRYINNKITEAVVFQGLEPFDTFGDMLEFIKVFRRFSFHDIVIYTGYEKDEIIYKLKKLIPYGNIIIKTGRYIPNQKQHYDPILGVFLASDNQKAFKLC